MASGLLSDACLTPSIRLHGSSNIPHHFSYSHPVSSLSVRYHSDPLKVCHLHGQLHFNPWTLRPEHQAQSAGRASQQKNLSGVACSTATMRQNTSTHPATKGSSPCLKHGWGFGESKWTARRQRDRYTRRMPVVAAESSTGSSSGEDKKESAELYGKIERVFADTARQSQGSSGERGRWEEIEGAWVLRPKADPKAIVHFIGGAFVGASPQLTYRLFLERLSERGLLIVTTPFASGFDHLRIADEAQFKFDRCTRTMGGLEALPVFGVGHSMGALTHMLIGARYAVQRRGNTLISFNNKEATRAIPLFSPVIVPMAQNLGPLIAQLTASPGVRLGAELAIKQLRNLSPPLLKQVLPLVDQLPPLYADLANGKDEFTPTPDETRRLIKTYYGVGRNLLIRFQDDTIDETPELAEALSRDSGVSGYLDLSIRTLPGDHARPLRQGVPELPPGMADMVTQGGELLAGLTANMPAGSPFAQLARGVGQLAGTSAGADQLREKILEDMELLVDEIVEWMGVGLRERGSRKGPQYLPGVY